MEVLEEITLKLLTSIRMLPFGSSSRKFSGKRQWPVESLQRHRKRLWKWNSLGASVAVVRHRHRWILNETRLLRAQHRHCRGWRVGTRDSQNDTALFDRCAQDDVLVATVSRLTWSWLICICGWPIVAAVLLEITCILKTYSLPLIPPTFFRQYRLWRYRHPRCSSWDGQRASRWAERNSSLHSISHRRNGQIHSSLQNEKPQERRQNDMRYRLDDSLTSLVSVTKISVI